MTTLDTFADRLNPQPTVKCSTCEADVELAKLADHTCSGSASSAPEYSDTHTANYGRMPVTQMPLTAEPLEMEEPRNAPPPKRGASLYQRQRPSLPRIDSNAPRRELDPREAASIAHDLGLPSPVSAGPGRRSPRPHLPRKGSSPRIPLAPPSPELPISQDCAFPPFPTNKPKRTQTQKDTRGPQPRSTSRANTHDATLSHSTSSSLYSSSSSGLVKSRTSDMSTRQRSRQGTLNGAPSPPSTAPSSPRRSMEQHMETEKQEGSYLSANHAAEDASFTPPPSAVAFPATEKVHALERAHTLDDMSYDNGMYSEGLSAPADPPLLQSEGSNSAVTFDGLFSSTESKGLDNIQQSYSEPSYKAKRPPPLEQMSSIPPERQFPAVNIKSPTTPMSAGLGRTLTNLFSRKRSQSVSSKKAAKFDVNSPRMKALAPEPPPIPTRGAGEFGAVNASEESYFPSQQTTVLQVEPAQSHEAVSPLTGSEQIAAAQDVPITEEDVISPLSTAEQEQTNVDRSEVVEEAEPATNVGFDFSFDGMAETEKPRKTDTMMIQSDFDDALATIAPPSDQQPEIALQRASVDSASSYGSVRFSQHTISTRSSPPPSDELRNKISNALRASTATIDDHEQFRPKGYERQPEQPDEPSAIQRRLSPVLERITMDFSQQLDEPISPEKNRTSPIAEAPRSDPGSESPRSRRPFTPAGNKGICRGCSHTIEYGQKSVSSKDGRLSGKYHKDCFGCQTCRQPFVTADFYVFNDHPYCSHHYHVLNNTLCTSCNKGIEGQYFEATNGTGHDSRKFHPRCFTCATCRVQLKDDYFEFQGLIYCERDAFRAANGPAKSVYDNAPSRPSPLNREYLSSGAPPTKGRFPERRTTKLMMT